MRGQAPAGAASSVPRAASAAGFHREVLLLLRPFWPVVLAATAVGSLGGLAAAGLLATINRGLHAPDGITPGLLLEFAGLCLLSVAGRAVAGVGNIAVGQKVVAAMRKSISACITRAPLATLERHRAHRLLTLLTDDIDTVSSFTFNFAGYVIAFAVALGSFLYLLVLSPAVFLLATVAVAAGIAIGVNAKRHWVRDYEKIRSAKDDLQKQYQVLAHGAKELRLHRVRRAHVHDRLLAGAADRIAGLSITAMRRFWIMDAIGAGIFFGVIGLLLAAQHRLGIEPMVVSGTVMVLLYVKGPIEWITSCLPALSNAQVAFRRIAEWVETFQGPGPAAAAPPGEPLPLPRSIELRGVRYEFAAVGRDTADFAFGPVDLAIRCGEAVFIVGENGSGKTTLVKLLLGLYSPTGGALLIDGVPVQPDRLDDYRQLFSAVFSDFHLFEDLAGGDAALDGQANQYLERLGLAHKVQVREGAFSTTDLSTGQRKRLALVHAFLDQRPIMMFDEWAADQDPMFRRVFYTELLPDLKRQGKTLIVISHDDRYFQAADRIVQLRDGRIVEERSLQAGGRTASAGQAAC